MCAGILGGVGGGVQKRTDACYRVGMQPLLACFGDLFCLFVCQSDSPACQIIAKVVSSACSLRPRSARIFARQRNTTHLGSDDARLMSAQVVPAVNQIALHVGMGDDPVGAVGEAVGPTLILITSCRLVLCPTPRRRIFSCRCEGTRWFMFVLVRV